MIDEKKMELIKKVYALAEHGERGERAAARRQLDRLLRKYNIDEADLKGDYTREYEFRYNGKMQKQILVQLFAKIAPDRTAYRYTRGRGKNSISILDCTEAEAVQIKIEFEFFTRLWEEELSLFLSAFIQKHRLFDDRPGHKITEVDDEKMFRLSAMMLGLQEKSPLKMIGGAHE